MKDLIWSLGYFPKKITKKPMGLDRKIPKSPHNSKTILFKAKQTIYFDSTSLKIGE